MPENEVPNTPSVEGKLDSRTPSWFREWHNLHFSSVCRRSRRNEKLIYVLLATILAAAALGNGNINLIGKLLGGFISAQGS